jgi:hypothetical protein
MVPVFLKLPETLIVPVFRTEKVGDIVKLPAAIPTD